MTGIIQKLKDKSIFLRKERSSLAPKIVFALSEIEKIGKNDGNRPTTDDEAVKVIQKIIATIDENLKLDLSYDVMDSLHRERQILSSVLPAMVTLTDIRDEMIINFSKIAPKNKGEVMKWAKSKWGVYADMKVVGSIASELYGV